MQNRYLTLVPFACFFGGYIVVSYVMDTPSLVTPTLVGSSLLNACETTSAHGLALKIVGHKQTLESPPGTILEQTPIAGSQIKIRQSMYVIICQEPEPIRAPNLIGLHNTNIENNQQEQAYKIKLHQVPSPYPGGICIAQYPAPGDPIAQSQLIAYISQKNSKPIIWPNFTGALVTDVRSFLRTHNIEPSCIHHYPQLEHHQCIDCRVTHQHPVAGSLLTLNTDKPVHVQLQVK